MLSSLWNALSGSAPPAAPAPVANASNSGGLLSFAGQVAYRNQPERRNGADYDYLFKIVVVGDSRIGKSAFLMRFVDQQFFRERYLSTIGCDFKCRSLEVGGVFVKLQLWDTAGQERFRSITSSYYRGASGMLLMYDITNRESFNSLPRWLHEMRDRSGCEGVLFVVGLKADAGDARQVSVSEGKAWADGQGLPFWEVSSKTDTNINNCMLQLCAVLCQQRGHSGVATDKALFDVHKKVADLAASEREEFDDEDLAARLDKVDANPDRKKKSNARQASKADPNVLRIALADLGKDAGLVTGDPLLCRRCGSAFSELSKIEQMTGTEAAKITASFPLSADFTPAPAIHPRLEKRSANARKDDMPAVTAKYMQTKGPHWCCEFCGAANEAVLDEGEIPRAAAVDYLLQPAPAVPANGSHGSVVFVVDISGSMAVTSEVRGKHALKGAERRQERLKEAAGSHADGAGQQRLPREAMNVTHISRLQAVQAAVEAQTRRIAREHPGKRVGLIAFSSEVTLYGDGTQAPLVVAGDNLHNWAELWSIGGRYSLQRSAREAEPAVLKRLWELEESGATALGPALVLGIAVAGATPGSQVILCTDGLANEGIGSLEGSKATFQAFYTETAEQALLRGVAVSVLSLTGTDCALENLSVVAERTSGSVERVDPQNLTGHMEALLSGPPVLSYRTMAMVLLHRGLRFRGEMDDEAEQRFWLVKDLGNVSAASECTVSYAFRPKSEVDLSKISAIPFQVQLLYTRPDGAVRLRVATAKISMTDDRQEAEQKADAKVIASHAAQHAAKLAKAGDYEGAQMETRAAQRLLQRGDHLDTLAEFSKGVEMMDDMMISERAKEEHIEPGQERFRCLRRVANDEVAVAISKTTKVSLHK